MKPLSSAATLLLLAFVSAQGENWPQFRGPNSQGRSSETNLPLRWSAEDECGVENRPTGPGLVVADRLGQSRVGHYGHRGRAELPGTGPGLERRANCLGTRGPSPGPRTQGVAELVCHPHAGYGRRASVCWFNDGSFAALDFSGAIVWTNRSYPFYSQHGLGHLPSFIAIC
jgi:hypothetical protein